MAPRTDQRVDAASASLRHDLERLQRRGIEPDRAKLLAIDHLEIKWPQHVANLFARSQHFRRHIHGDRPRAWMIAAIATGARPPLRFACLSRIARSTPPPLS